MTSGTLVGTTTDVLSYNAPIAWAVYDLHGSNFPVEGGLTVMVNPQPSTLNPRPSTLNSQPSTQNPKPSTLDP